MRLKADAPQNFLGRGAVVVVLALLLMSPAAAQDESFDFELTPFVGARFGGTVDVRDSTESWELDDSSSFGFALNWRHSGETMWEVIYSKQDTEAEFTAAGPDDQPIDVEMQLLQLGGTYQFEGNKTIPYIVATVGGTHAEVIANGSESDTFASFSIGGGVLIRPDSRIGLRLEGRYIGTVASSSTDLFCRTGPEGGACNVRIEGELLSQFEVFAGVVIRF